MRVSVVTLFPGFFSGPLETSILKRASSAGLVTFDLIDLRTFGEGRHRVTDDYPFGGGAGMVMKPGPVVHAIERTRETNPGVRVSLLTPQGRLFSQHLARQMARSSGIGLVCGRYEGYDERIRAFCDDEISVGDFVLMGGEAAALVVIEAVVRLVPGVLGASQSHIDESLADGLLEYPQYTRPRVFRGMAVPGVLVAGDHAEIAKWRRRQALARTALRRPDLFSSRTQLTEDEWAYAPRGCGGEDPGCESG